jgi:GNAT superfamily N-acetyltransferase
MDTELRIRRARPGDRPAMEHICAHTWEGDDYVPEVWEEWLADPGGALIVGEIEEDGSRVVALSKITFQPAGQVWLEGMRVDPGYRGRGIAGRFLEYSFDYARDRGARVVRLATAGDNTPVHKLMARTGMTHVGVYNLWGAEPLPEGEIPVFLEPGQAPAARAFLQESAVLCACHGLYILDWAWQSFSDARLDHFLATGGLAAETAPGGQIRALALVDRDPEDDEAWLGYADGQPGALAALLRRARAWTAHQGASSIRVMVPHVPHLRQALSEAGYGVGDWEDEMWVFERQMTAASEAVEEAR